MAGMNLSFLLVISSLVGLRVLHRAESQPLSFKKHPAYLRYEKTSWALFAACWFSLAMAGVFPFSYAGIEPEVTFHGFLKIWYLCVPSILFHLVLMGTRQDSGQIRSLLDRCTRYWFQALLVLFGVAIIQFFTGWPLKQAIPTNPTFHHVILFFGHHLSTASIIPFATFAAASIAFGKRKRTGHWPRLESTAALAGAMILFLSYARTAWLSLPIGVALLLARSLSKKQFVAALLSMGILLTALSFTPAMKERIRNNMGIQDRFLLWEANLDYFKNRPLTGIGWLKTQEMSGPYFKHKAPEHYRDYFWGHAHSNFFEMLGGTGIIGLLAFLAWSWMTLSLGYQTAQLGRGHLEGDLAFGLFIGLVLLHINGLTNVTFWEGKVMHQQMIAVGVLLVLNWQLSRSPSHSQDLIN
jgi:O-antigen ligase